MIIKITSLLAQCAALGCPIVLYLQFCTLDYMCAVCAVCAVRRCVLPCSILFHISVWSSHQALFTFSPSFRRRYQTQFSILWTKVLRKHFLATFSEILSSSAKAHCRRKRRRRVGNYSFPPSLLYLFDLLWRHPPSRLFVGALDRTNSFICVVESCFFRTRLVLASNSNCIRLTTGQTGNEITLVLLNISCVFSLFSLFTCFLGCSLNIHTHTHHLWVGRKFVFCSTCLFCVVHSASVLPIVHVLLF